MGQKINAISFRLGLTRTWNSLWYTKKDNNIRRLVHEDLLIQEYLRKIALKLKFKLANIFIKRNPTTIWIWIAPYYHKKRYYKLLFKNKILKTIKEFIYRLTGLKHIFILKTKARRRKIHLIRNAYIFAKWIQKLIQKKPYKLNKFMKKILKKIKRSHFVKAIKVQISGRNRGRARANQKIFTYKGIPLQSIKEKIDYAFIKAKTKSGLLGIKVWVNLK